MRKPKPNSESQTSTESKPATLTVRTNVRAGHGTLPSLGNKVWQDDWLAPV